MAADAANREVGEVGGETVSRPEFRENWFGHAQVVDFEKLATNVAEEVKVVRIGSQVIAGGTAPVVAVADEPEPFEHFKGAIDRRSVDHRQLLVDPLKDIFRRDVSGTLFEESENQLPLRGQTQTTFAQNLAVHEFPFGAHSSQLTTESSSFEG